MELDSRIIEGKKPLDCFDTKIAEQFLGKKGYFSDYLNEYTHICNTEEDVLQSLDEHHDEAYKGSRNKWEFFLPAEWVKEEPAPKHIDFEVAKKDKNFERCDLYGEELLFDTKNNIFYTSDGNVHAYLTTMAQHRYNEEQTKDVIIEKKYRPFTGIEFAEKFGLWIGHIIRIRDRPENAGQEYEYKIMFVGYRWYKGLFEVFINGCWIDLLTLFELYEYMEDGEWHKFGVEE